MQNLTEPDRGMRQVAQYMWRHPARWFLPALLIGALGCAYAAWMYEPQWVARQALTVREDYPDQGDWQGQFNEAEQLKHTQETFLELAKSPAVVTAALVNIGPPASYKHRQQWPTSEDIARARDHTEVVAPNGLEFGTTRMFYLNVSDPDRPRASELATAICEQSTMRFQQLRTEEMRNTIVELTSTEEMATSELNRETERLQKMESEAGSDLAELRMLSESFAGGSNLQTTLSEVQQELRQAESAYSSNQQLLRLLVAAQEDPSNLVATSNRLLEAQPALRRLKDGLIDAQLNTSQLLGTMSEEHPRVKAALVAESEIRKHLHQELAVAVRGLQSEQTLAESRIQVLNDKVTHLQQRLQTLAEMRAAYTNQLAEVRQRTDSLTSARQALNATRANLAASDVIMPVMRVDTPQTGPHAEGPGRTVLAAASGVGGLMVGLGILVLSLPVGTGTTPRELVPGTQATARDTTPSTVPDVQRPVQPAAADVPEPPHRTVAARRAAPEPSRPSISIPPVQAPAATAARRSMTLREALVRCGDAEH